MELIDSKIWISDEKNLSELRILFQKFRPMMNELTTTTKKADKDKIIEKYASDSPLIQKILAAYSYDAPKIKTQISGGDHKNVVNYMLNKFNPKLQQLHIPKGGILSLLKILTNRIITGDDAMHLAVCYLHVYSLIPTLDKKKSEEIIKEMKPIIFSILSLDFKFGLKKSEHFNKFQSLHNDYIIELNGGKDMGVKVLPELADTYEPDSKYEYKWISRKLDGERCFMIVDYNTKEVYCKSRTNVAIPQLKFMADEIPKEAFVSGFLGFKNGFILDGEITVMEQDDKENFNAVAKITRSKKLDEKTLEKCYYYVFNIIDIDDMKNNTFTMKFSEALERLNVLFKYIKFNKIKQLPQIPFSEATLAEEFKNVEQKGYEGLILRCDVPYQGGKRNSYMAKYKTMQDAEFICASLNIGDYKAREGGQEITLKGVVCSVNIIHPKGNTVSIGSGFTIQQRKDFAKDPKLIVGKRLKIKYFEETFNQKGEVSLRFPIFHAIL